MSQADLDFGNAHLLRVALAVEENEPRHLLHRVRHAGLDGLHPDRRHWHARAACAGVHRRLCHAGMFGPPNAPRCTARDGTRCPADRGKLRVSVSGGSAGSAERRLPTNTVHNLLAMMKLSATLALVFLTSCTTEVATEYTLYRTGIDIPTQTHDETLRIHVATFNAHQDANYNLANCEFAHELFTSSQPHFRNYRSNTVAAGTIKVKYWCEKGRFKK